MKVSDLKEIYKLMNCGGLIDEINIKPDGTIVGVDAGKTFIASLKYPITIPNELCLQNIKGIVGIAEKFSDCELSEVDGRLHINEGKKFAHLLLKAPTTLGFNLPEYTNENYDVIITGVPHTTLNALGKFRADSLVNELYYFFIQDDDLMLRIGSEDSHVVGDIVAKATKSKSTFSSKFTMNVSECFKNIFTNANIYMIQDKIMIVECVTEKYTVRYYLAPRVDS